MAERPGSGSGSLDLRGRHFVLLGAGSAMGPLEMLLRFGATVHAVDLPRPAIWRRLLAVEVVPRPARS